MAIFSGYFIPTLLYPDNSSKCQKPPVRPSRVIEAEKREEGKMLASSTLWKQKLNMGRKEEICGIFGNSFVKPRAMFLEASHKQYCLKPLRILIAF